MQYKCKICEKEFKSLWGLSSHNVQKHKGKPKELYIEVELGGVHPTCGCGCGENTKFLGIRKGFSQYIRGHSQRINNNWGHNPKALEKSHNTQRKMYESGELTIWNKGLDINDERVKKGTEKMLQNTKRGGKISKSLKGRKRPQEVLDKLHEGMKNYWSSDVNREKQSHTRVLHMKKHRNIPTSKLENVFKGLLNTLNVEYYQQFYVRDTKSLYDFKIKGRNIMIEVDGDFWHCNPKTNPQPIYESQKNNLRKDLIKNEWCLNNDITLLRFWESDINERPEWVKSEILRHIE